MKVAYNNCFGGFSLSNLALKEFAKKKRITLTWYEQVGYQPQGNELVNKKKPAKRGLLSIFYELYALLSLTRQLLFVGNATILYHRL